MNNYRNYVLFWVLLLVFCSASAKIKPQWVKNTPTPGNSSYVFKVVEVEGVDLNSARSMALRALVSKIEHDNKIEIVEYHKLVDIEQQEDGVVTEATSNSTYVLDLKSSINKSITAENVAEYWEDFESNGQKKKRLYSLFMVQRPNRTANFDDVKLTTKYGMRGFVRSMIVPGWGQIYKGSAVKGGFILGGAVAVAAGIIITENTRADYIKKMHEQPKFADVYNSKATDWETARNVCIGAAAALYIYNLVDAVAADGAERAIVKKRNNNFSFAPVVTPDGGGFSLVYKF